MWSTTQAGNIFGHFQKKSRSLRIYCITIAHAKVIHRKKKTKQNICWNDFEGHCAFIFLVGSFQSQNGILFFFDSKYWLHKWLRSAVIFIRTNNPAWFIYFLTYLAYSSNECLIVYFIAKSAVIVVPLTPKIYWSTFNNSYIMLVVGKLYCLYAFFLSLVNISIGALISYKWLHWTVSTTVTTYLFMQYIKSMCFVVF